MMGRSHVVAGWCLGLATAPLFGLHTVETVVPFAATAAGFSLVPDLDHPGAKASRLLGPVTGTVSRVVRFASARVYRLTKGPRDEDWSGKHRHLSHTLVVAALLGWLAAWGTSAGGPWAVAAVCVAGLVLAVDGLGDGAVGDWFAVALLGAGVLWWCTVGSLGVLSGVAGWIGWAVFIGCFAHDLADSLTYAGCPWLWPLPIAGETWFELKFLGPLAFHTGSVVERRVVQPLLILLGVGLLLHVISPSLFESALTPLGHLL